MRPKVAKSGTIHIQHSMFADEEHPPKADPSRYVYTITFSAAYEGFLEAYRKGEPPDKAEVVTDGGYAVQIRQAVILDADNGERYEWTQIQSAAHTAYQAETADDQPKPPVQKRTRREPPPTYFIDWFTAWTAMAEALRTENDPWMAKVEVEDGSRVALAYCQITGEMNLAHALEYAKHHRAYEEKVEEVRLKEELVHTDNWSM